MVTKSLTEQYWVLTMKKRQSNYATNLASEFFVMSVLHRLGLEAYLTLGNKKAVDFVVVHAPGNAITIDVKAVAGKVDWLVGNVAGTPRERHYVVLITYNGKFAHVNDLPDAWIFPHKEFLELVKTAKMPSTMRYISRVAVLKLTERAQAWHLLRANEGVADETKT